ncbi:MAG TPA: hypothetical protein VFR90_01560 [Methylibium sp.]|uniref:hypothetical protein n=1 Tax=Methylibium sp. TaxID=2067992 RepID=UPI002DB99DFD|nr:hypothetical protein [Methylibium sp.]HEU4457793.1 hypothetical protein [Methylibium sp.]
MKASTAMAWVLTSSVCAQALAYDPMEDLVSTAKKEINAKAAIETAKGRALNDPRRKKIEAGYWQFFRGKSDAKPGEFCTGVFWKVDRMIVVSGPGGAYRGAMLAFVAIEPPDGFPRPADAKLIERVKVTLRQGNDPSAEVTAFNRTIGAMADEIAFPVPTIDAALAGMDDRLAFAIEHGGRQVFALEWHSGRAAREVLTRCLKGEDVAGREVP